MHPDKIASTVFANTCVNTTQTHTHTYTLTCMFTRRHPHFTVLLIVQASVWFKAQTNAVPIRFGSRRRQMQCQSGGAKLFLRLLLWMQVVFPGRCERCCRYSGSLWLLTCVCMHVCVCMLRVLARACRLLVPQYFANRSSARCLCVFVCGMCLCGMCLCAVCVCVW